MNRIRLSVLVALILGGCAGDDRKQLTIYSPHGKEMLGAYEERFEAEHPDVDVRWMDMGGQDAYDRIRTERENPQASLWWGGASMAFNRAAGEDLLQPYRPTWAGAVPPTGKGPDDLWYGTYFTPEVITYNARSLADEEAPQDWDEMLDPRWKDRIIIRYPLASSTMRTIWGAMILRQPSVEAGYDWLARLDRNVKTYTADPTQLYLKLARGEGDVTLWNMPDTYIQANTVGYPFEYVVPASGTPVLTDGIALVKGGPNLDVAEAFYEFVTSEAAMVDQANTFFRIPVRTDIPSDRLPEWITGADVKPMTIDWERLDDEGAEWMQYWDEHIKGRGEEYLRGRGTD